MQEPGDRRGPDLRIAALLLLVGTGACVTRRPLTRAVRAQEEQGSPGQQETGQQETGAGKAGEETPAPAPAADEQPAPAPASEALPPAPPGLGELVDGSFALRYRGRFTGDDQDHELRGILALDVQDPRNPWISAHLLARGELALDGNDEGAVFQDLSSTYSQAFVGHVYAAWVDVALGDDPLTAAGSLRVGRQTDPELPELLRFDGVSFRSRPRGEHALVLGGYGGLPAYIHSDASREDERAWGAFVDGIPWEGGRMRLDWMHLEDELILGPQRDDLLALGLWQRIEGYGWFEGRFSHLEGDPRDLELAASVADADGQTTLRVRYDELLQTQKVRAVELDPFYESLQEYYPYRQLSLDGAHELSRRLRLEGGIDLRRVSDDDDVGEFNRDWERYHVTTVLHDMRWGGRDLEGLAVALTADRWNDDGRDIGTLGADVSWGPEGPWDIAVGSYYALYKYSLLELSEREDVRTTYVRTTWEASKVLRLELGYEYEDDDLDVYHTLLLGARWRF